MFSNCATSCNLCAPQTVRGSSVQLDSHGKLRLYNQDGIPSGMLDGPTLKRLRNVVDGNEALHINTITVKKSAEIRDHKTTTHTTRTLDTPKMTFRQRNGQQRWTVQPTGSTLRFSNGNNRASFGGANIGNNRVCTQYGQCFTPSYLKVWQGKKPFSAQHMNFIDTWRIKAKN